MKIHKIIQRRIRGVYGGVDVAGDVNAVVAGNVGGQGTSAARASSTHHVRQDTQSTPPRRKED